MTFRRDEAPGTGSDDEAGPPKLPAHLRLRAAQLADEIDQLSGAARDVVLDGVREILEAGAGSTEPPRHLTDGR